MRLSITLEDDLYAVARSLARAEDCSISAAVNRLLRRAIEQPGGRTPVRRGSRSAFPTSPGRRLITEDDVKALEDRA